MILLPSLRLAGLALSSVVPVLVSQATVVLVRLRPELYIHFRETLVLINALLHNNLNVTTSKCTARPCFVCCAARRAMRMLLCGSYKLCMICLCPSANPLLQTCAYLSSGRTTAAAPGACWA